MHIAGASRASRRLRPRRDANANFHHLFSIYVSFFYLKSYVIDKLAVFRAKKGLNDARDVPFVKYYYQNDIIITVVSVASSSKL